MQLPKNEVFPIKPLPLDKVTNMSSAELISKLEAGELSLLKSFRIGPVRFLKSHPSRSRISAYISWTFGLFTMKYIVGPICRFVLFCVLFELGGTGAKDEKYWYNKRKKGVKVGRFFFPDIVIGETEVENADKTGLVVGFNHPTLHEILGLITWSLDRFPSRRNNFPTNLPWYESICTRSPAIRGLGIWITPLITQSTFGKLEKIHEGDPETIAAISRVSKILVNQYFQTAADFERTGDNTFSAPSATRQATIFPNHLTYRKDQRLLPAMSGLLFYIARANRERDPQVMFLPITAIPPMVRIKRLAGLKPFRRYELIIGRGFSMEEARKLGRELDYAFLTRLTENAPEELWYPPLEIDREIKT